VKFVLGILLLQEQK